MSAPYYRFFVADYTLKAGHLSMLEHGAYRLLIDRYMAIGGPIPFDLAHLYRLLHATSKEEQQAVQTVIEEFFKMDGDTLRNRRCDAELAFQARVTSHQRNNALQRWGKDIDKNQPDTCGGNAVAMPPQCQPEPEPEPDKKSRGTRMPETALPTAWLAYCSQTRPDLNPIATFERFHDYWCALPGKRGVRLDWLMTWRNWVRNERKSSAPPVLDPFAGAI